jgi:hypothetical protein
VSSTDVIADVPAKQRLHPVYRHPDRDRIEALMRRGKTSYWIGLWLEDTYPVTDEPEDDEEAAESAANEKMLLDPEVLDYYRENFMPDCKAGVDVVMEGIEDIVGRRFPASSRGKDFELELLDMSIDVAQHMMAQALEQDDRLKMGVSETTLQAHQELMSTIQASVALKQAMGIDGYEAPIERHQYEHTNKNLNVNLHGVVDARTGELGPVDQSRVDAVLGLLAAPPDRAAEVLDATAEVVKDDGAAGRSGS